MRWRARSCSALLLSLLALTAGVAHADELRIERNVIYGMYSGLALLMDVYRPAGPNGYGVVFISGSGWHAPLNRNARPLKESGQEKVYAVPLVRAGYTVFVLNHRAAPRFRYPAAVEDVQRAVRFVRNQHILPNIFGEARIPGSPGVRGQKSLITANLN